MAQKYNEMNEVKRVTRIFTCKEGISGNGMKFELVLQISIFDNSISKFLDC